jgi:RNA polymerase sigma-70 factor (ECF subfamily)
VADVERHRDFMALLDGHGAAVMATLRRLCRSRHDAEDVFQETAARVWRHLPGRAELRNPRAWLMTVAYRAFVDARARRRHHPPEAVGDSAGDSVIDPVDTRVGPPDRAAERTETCDRVHAAVAGLPAAVREVVALHYQGGLTIAQTAAAMDVSEGTVKSRLNAALRRLREALEESE